jgi:phosphotriesterase-related protein
VKELSEVHAAGGRAIVDMMPGGAGRNVEKLVAVAQRSGMHIIAPTGLHLEKYYPPDHWQQTITTQALADYFVDEIENGIGPAAYGSSGSAATDATGYAPKTGVIKVAGSRDALTETEKRNFDAAANAQAATGCPIITHTDAGTAGHEQLDRLEAAGVSLDHVVLFHVDRVEAVQYHRELLDRGVTLE